MTKIDNLDFPGSKSLWGIFYAEWKWWLPGAMFSFVLASVLMSGWPQGLIPNLAYPYVYEGDGLFQSWCIQRLIEGWFFDNPRSGYPFGSNFLDYPGTDTGNELILKLLGTLTGEYQSAFNLFFLFGFAVTFIASFCVLRAIGLNIYLGFSAAVLFDFLPFHFQRLEHLYYTWYFVVPLLFYVAFFLFFYPSRNEETKSRKALYLIGCTSIFVVIASFGVYYALFGTILLSVSGLAVWIKTGEVVYARRALMAVLLITFGVLINVSPNLIHKYVNGKNQEAAVRSPAEAEYYGLKMMQLILPRAEHRVQRLATITRQYNSTRPLVNENSTSALGVIGTTGFLLVGLIFLISLSGGKVEPRMALLTLLVMVLFLFGTIGGLGALFSSTISSSIRGWNRISIFISFGSIAAFFLMMQFFIHRFFSSARSKFILSLAAPVVLVIGLYDQTVPACISCNEQTKSAYEADSDFIQKIESSLPEGSAIYQLPYMPFPEVPPLYRLHDYDLVVGFIQSKSLHWSYAGMKGREGDLFYRSLSKELIDKQLNVIKKLGFAGIYIDRRGFADNAKALLDRLTLLVGPPSLVRADGEVIFFRVVPMPNVNLSGLTSKQIMQKAGYDKLGARYAASLLDGIDFTRRDWPEFVQNISGLSGPEPWGRWSDANVAPAVRIDFFDSLPQKFTLVLVCQPFGPNTDHELTVKIGVQEHQIKMPSGTFEARLSVNLEGENVESVEFLPPYPTSPHELGISEDSRKLGVGFVRMWFEE